MEAFSLSSLFYTALGVFVGLLAGAIPGLTGVVALGLLLPVSFYLSPVAALGLLIGAYKGSIFGGSITAIGFGTPGTPETTVSVFDGYALTKKGYPRKAMGVAHWTSSAADLTTDLLTIAVTAPLAAVAAAFGPRELFALALAAFVVISVFIHGSPIRGLVSALLGILLGTVGPDPITGTARLTFGVPLLQGGIELVPFLIGLFALTEIWSQLGGLATVAADQHQKMSEELLQERMEDDHLSFREWLALWKEVGIGIFTGAILGALPGPGATMSAYTSYGISKRVSSDRHRFGSGSLHGLAAAEAGNSATVGPAFIPLFAFGIPGSVLAALFAAGFLMHGITPGPTMLINHREVVYGFFILLIVSNFINFFMAKALIPVFSRVARVNPAILMPVLLVLSVLGAYAYSNSLNGVIFMLIGAVIGSLLYRWRFPLAPLLVALIVAPLLEGELRRSLLLGQGSIGYFFASPLAVVLYVLAGVAVWYFLIRGGGGSATDVDRDSSEVAPPTKQLDLEDQN